MKKAKIFKKSSIAISCMLCFTLISPYAFNVNVIATDINQSVEMIINAVLNRISDDELAAIASMVNQLGGSSVYDWFETVLTTTSAYDENNIYDLTGDNEIGIEEPMFVSSFLQGESQYSYEYTELDGDGDGKIDNDDCTAYFEYYTDVLCGIIEDACITTHTTRTYTLENLTINKYNASNGNYISSYFLTPATAMPNFDDICNSLSENKESSLQNEYPNHQLRDDYGMPNEDVIYHGIYNSNVYPSGVIKIRTYYGTNFGASGLGSGFVIDDHTIATAAHIVYNLESASSLSSCKVKNRSMIMFSSNGTPLTNISITPVEYHVPQKYTEGYINGYDFVIITVQENLQNYVSLSLGLPLLEFINSGETVFNTGTPGSVAGTPKNYIDNSNVDHHELYTTGDSIYNYYANTTHANDLIHKIIGAECPCTASGGPLYYPANQAVLGIVRAGVRVSPSQYYNYSASTSIRSEMLKFYYNNPSISYT